MNRLRDLFKSTYPDLDRHPLGLAVMSMAMLTIYVEMGKRRSMPDAWVEWIDSLLGFGDPQLARYLWKNTMCALLLMVGPLILMRAFAGWSPRDLGFRIRGTWAEFKLVTVLWLLFLPVLWVVSDFPSFDKTYPQVRGIKTDGLMFAAHHAYYILYWMGWEFYFRGLLLFGFERDYQSKAVLLSTFPFVVMHYGKPPIEMMAAIAAGFILCGIALRSRSILPGVFLHWLVQMSIDFANCTWWR